MRQAVRAIVINNGNLLVMHRNKFGEQYNTLPGGNVEIGETPEQALKREVYDETQYHISKLNLVYIEHCDHPYGDQLIYVCEYTGPPEPKLLPGCEEDEINKLGKNLYQPKWLPISDLEDAPFVTKELKEHLLKAVAEFWPKIPLEFHSSR